MLNVTLKCHIKLEEILLGLGGNITGDNADHTSFELGKYWPHTIMQRVIQFTHNWNCAILTTHYLKCISVQEMYIMLQICARYASEKWTELLFMQ